MDTNKLLAIIIVLLTGGYLLPFSIAVWRGHGAVTKIFLINLLLGWTIIGWLVSLIWSLR